MTQRTNRDTDNQLMTDRAPESVTDRVQERVHNVKYNRPISPITSPVTGTGFKEILMTPNM